MPTSIYSSYVFRTIAALVVLLSGKLPALAADDVTIYTENFPPYNYLTEDGEVDGVSTKLVKVLLEEAGLKYQFRMLPWQRAVRAAESDERGLIYSIARLAKREDQYDWLAYLTRPEFYLYALKGDNRRVTFEAIREGQFTAICVDSDASCTILQEVGFTRDKLFVRGGSRLSDAVMLGYGRADLYLGDINNQAFRLQELDLPEDFAKPVLRVREGLRLYLAAGFHVDAEIREKIKVARNRLLQAGVLTPD